MNSVTLTGSIAGPITSREFGSGEGAKTKARFLLSHDTEPSGDGTLVRETWDVSQEKGPVKYLLRIGRSREHTRGAMEKTLANIALLTEGN